MPLASWSGMVALRAAKRTPFRLQVVGRLAIMLVPAALLAGGILRTEMGGQPQLFLLLGTAFQILLCSFSFRYTEGWRQPIGASVLLVYLTGLGWLWLLRSLTDLDDLYLHFAQAILLIVALTVFAVHVLVNSGAPEWRRAQVLAKRLGDRKDWPTDLVACALLPEVKALREALHVDAAPALFLLGHPRPQVRMAALAAFEFRKHWRTGQAQMVLQVARQSPEPAIRAAAVMALANVDDRVLVEDLSEFLRDPAPDVRRAASQALLWDTGQRWSWIRVEVRRSLADSTFLTDGPLLPSSHQLTAEAVKDLTAWAAEKGFLAIRAAQTLAVHYRRILSERMDDKLLQELQRTVADPHAPAPLRLELAHLLQENQVIDHDLEEKLLDPANPAPLRLMAADRLLAHQEHTRAFAALTEVARLPNREIALATAEVIQRRLGVDLGLPIDQPPPPVHSRLAAEVTRRVMAWGSHKPTLEVVAQPDHLLKTNA